MAVHFRKPEPFIVRIDGEPIRLHFKRMDVREWEEYNAVFTAFGGGRNTPGPEPAPLAADVTLTAVRERASTESAKADEDAGWIQSVFARYVTVQAGDLIVDDQPVTDGGKFLAIMTGMDGLDRIIIDVLAQLWLEHRLTPAQKKTLRSLPAFGTGSTTAPARATSGGKPATAATGAGNETSAPAAAATAPSRSASSGMTAPRRSSGRARSGSSQPTRTSS